MEAETLVYSSVPLCDITINKRFSKAAYAVWLTQFTEDRIEHVKELSPRDWNQQSDEKIRRNEFQCDVDEETTKKLIFKTASFFNHSCVPNCAIASPLNDEMMIIKTLKPIKKGEELTICYSEGVFIHGDDPSRRIDVLNERCFRCACDSCKNSSSIQPCEWFTTTYVPFAIKQGLVTEGQLVTEICWWCGFAAEKKCSKCNKAYYCSRDCQVKHWHCYHRYRCNTSRSS